MLLALLSLPLAVPLMRTVSTRTDGPSLNEALAKTGMLLGRLLAAALVGVLLS